MFVKHKLKKIGFRMEDLDNMNINDIIKLGDMGYTKDEIEAMRVDTNTNMESQLASLQEQLNNLIKSQQVQNVHNTVDVMPNQQQQIESALNILAGGGNNGTGTA